MIVTDEDFIKIWQSSKNLDEVVKRTGLKRGTLSGRAYLYRKKGVPLKMFDSRIGKGRKPNDWKALASLAKSVKP